MPLGQTVIQTFYREILERLRKRVERVRPGIARTCILHHDNAPCHTVLCIIEFLAKKKNSCISAAPLFAESQSLLLLFTPRLKNHLKERHFGTLDNIQKSVNNELKNIPAEAFQHCYEHWKQRLRRCVAAKVNYFEGYNIDLKKNKFHF